MWSQGRTLPRSIIKKNKIIEPSGSPFPATDVGLRLPRRTVAIIALSLGTMLTTLDGAIVTVALPTITIDLRVQPSAAVLVVTVFQLIVVMAVLPFAALGDRIGHRTLYQWGQVVLVLATLLCCAAKTFPLLLLSRSIQALGAAAVLSVVSAMIRSIYPAARLGRGLALNVLVSAITAAAAPSLGGIILTFAGWQWLFGLSVPFGLLSILIGMHALPDPVRKKMPYDIVAAVLCAAMFGLGIGGLEGGILGGPLTLVSVLIASAGAVGIAFTRREMRSNHPILPVDLLKTKSFSIAIFGLAAAHLGTMIILLTLPFRLQQIYGFSSVELGFVVAAWPIAIMAVAPAASMMSDRFPAGLLGAVGMGIGALGISALTFLPTSPTPGNVAWRVAVFGIGFGMFFATSARQIIDTAPLDRTAAAGALSSTARMTGQALGATAVSGLLAVDIGLGSAPCAIAAALALVTASCSLQIVPRLIRGHLLR